MLLCFIIDLDSMDLFSNIFPSLQCYRDPEKCKHFKQRIEEEQNKEELAQQTLKKRQEEQRLRIQQKQQRASLEKLRQKDLLEQKKQRKLQKEKQKKKEKIDLANSRIALKSIATDFDLDFLPNRVNFFRIMKSYPPNSPELKACALKLHEWIRGSGHRGRSNTAKKNLLDNNFSVEQITYIRSFNSNIRDDIFFANPSLKFWKEPLFTGTICQDAHLFISMVRGGNLNLSYAPTNQLHTCLNLLKDNDQAVDLLSEKLI